MGISSRLRSLVATPEQGQAGRFPYWEKSYCFPYREAIYTAMNVFNRRTLETFWRVHADAKQPLLAWFSMAKSQTWTNMNDVVATYSKASPINSERCVFDIRGGSYRLIVAFHFASQSIYVKFLDTHARYNKVDAATVDDFQGVSPMTIKPIRTDSDHEAALSRIKELWNATPGTPESDEFDVLTVLVSQYEDRRWSFPAPDPVEAIKFHMEQNDYLQKDLARVVGSVSRASEILNRNRSLSLQNIRDIHAAWSIPLESLIGGSVEKAA
jgi:HTH-type transcriptional regulator / antitoxin HigA